jgi:hypothetical protein
MALLENRPVPAKLLNWVAGQGYDMDELLQVLGSDIANTMHAVPHGHWSLDDDGLLNTLWHYLSIYQGTIYPQSQTPALPENSSHQYQCL